MSITHTSSFRNFVDLESQAHVADGMTAAMLTTFYAKPEELKYVSQMTRLTDEAGKNWIIPKHTGKRPITGIRFRA